MESLIIKYLNGEANEHQVSLVFNWIEASQKNKKEFSDLKKTWAMSRVSKSDKKIAWHNIQNSTPKIKFFNFSYVLKYAAVFVIFISIGSLLWVSKKQDVLEPINVVLEIEETNTKINLVKNRPILGKQLINNVVIQNENEIVYKNENISEPITYHTLNIPFGKTFKVTLSDGTIVHLNAGSRLKYPRQFNYNNNRKVYLQGEAFFKVKKNENSPFIVETNKFDIEVLGTEFNVNTLNLNDYIDCVLVEGSVRLSNNNVNEVILNPNEKATWNITSKTFNISQVNTKIYTSWVHGELVFKDSNFEDISNKLTQFYNVKIENHSNSLKTQKFSGTINLKGSSIESILDLLRIDTPFSYIKNDRNTIIISNQQP